MKNGIRQLWRLPDIGGVRRSMPGGGPQYIVGSGGVMLPAYMAAGDGGVITPGDDAYPWYPALDLSQIPFHVGAGAWGARVIIQPPAAPTITSTSTASNASQLQAAMAIPGRRVTLTANIASMGVSFPVTDVEVVVPNGILVSPLGLYSGAAIQRLRFIKAPGDTIGGQMHEFQVNGGSPTDLIFDGLRLSGNSGTRLSLYFETAPERVAVVNCQLKSVFAVFGYGCRHLVVAGCSALHDSNNTIETGDWGWRQGGGTGAIGPFVYFQNDTRGAHYAHLRFHPSPAGAYPYYAWASENIFAGSAENGDRSIDMTDVDGSSGYPRPNGAWLLNNTVYCNSGNLGMNMAAAAAYTRVNGNTAYGASSGFNYGTASNGNASGNTYHPTPVAAPPWAAAGDPSGINVNP